MLGSITGSGQFTRECMRVQRPRITEIQTEKENMETQIFYVENPKIGKNHRGSQTPRTYHYDERKYK